MGKPINYVKTQFGQLMTGDFEEKTMTFEIEGNMVLQFGNYAIIPQPSFDELLKALNLMVNNFDGLENNGAKNQSLLKAKAAIKKATKL
jgi:hypothetical protein